MFQFNTGKTGNGSDESDCDGRSQNDQLMPNLGTAQRSFNVIKYYVISKSNNDKEFVLLTKVKCSLFSVGTAEKSNPKLVIILTKFRKLLKCFFTNVYI